MKFEKKKRRHALKGFSLFFAFFLWLYVLSSAQTKGERIVTVVYKTPQGFSIKNQPVKEITFSVKGPRVFIRALMQKRDTLVVDLKDKFKKNKGRYEVNVSELEVNFPFGVELTRVEPNRLVVQLEKSLTKEVPVKLVTLGNVPSDHKMVRSDIEPKKIRITGAVSVARKIQELETVPVDLNGLTGTGSQKVPLSLVDDRLDLVQNSIEYSYVINPTRANMTLKNIPVRFFSSSLVKAASSRTVDLMVLADNEKGMEYGKNDIQVIAQTPPGATGKVEVELTAKLPPGLHLLEIKPSKITLEVEGK